MVTYIFLPTILRFAKAALFPSSQMILPIGIPGLRRGEIFNLKGACKEAGIDDFRFHDLRHTAASLLACGGCDIIMLKNILGHKSLEMTQRYAHLIPDTHEKTRLIMSSIWGQEGNTFSDTPKKSEEKKIAREQRY